MKPTSRIIKYLDGKMSESELKQFREDLLKDPELVQELDLHRSIKNVVSSQDEARFRNKLNEAYKIYKIGSVVKEPVASLSKKFRRAKILKITLPVLMVIGLVFTLQTFRRDSNEKIFNEYFLPFQKDLTCRNDLETSSANPMLVRGVNNYFQKNYSEASQQLHQVLLEEPDNAEASFYNGLCYICLNDMQSAVSSFDIVLHLPYNYYQDYAEWYIALCYIASNNHETARAILEEIAADTGFFSIKAKKVLKRLR